MNRRFVGPLLASAICSLLFFAYDVWNWIRYASILICGDGPLDAAMHWVATPGRFLAAFVVLVLYRNVHNYNSYVFEIVQVLANSLLYGFALWGLWRLAKLCFHARRGSAAAA
jgi:hypothetical protein